MEKTILRPTLARHETRLSLLEQAREHDAERDVAMLKTLQEIRDELKAFREHADGAIAKVEERQNGVDTLLAEARGTINGVKLGWAAAFALIGGGIVAVVTKISEIFQ